LDKTAGISRLRVLREYEKIAFTNISRFHNNWIERKEFEKLTDSEKACIESIETKIVKENKGTNLVPEIVDVEFVKVKLFDKIKALENISRMLGYNEPDKLDINAMSESELDLIIERIKINFK
jgi:phage terminase small subunit